MKTFIILALLCLSRSQIVVGDELPPPQGKNLLDDFIMAIINNFKDVIINGNKCTGTPPLDPLQIPVLKLNISSSLFKMTGNVTNVLSEGLKSLEATRVSSNLISLKMDLGMFMPEMYIAGDYDVSGLAALIFPIYGKGPFYLRVGALNITGGGQMAVNLAGILSLKALDFNVTIGEIEAKFEGLLGGGDLGDVINQIVNGLAVDVYNGVWAIVHDVLMSSLLEFINTQLEGIKFSDIIGGIIKPPGGGGDCVTTPSYVNYGR